MTGSFTINGGMLTWPEVKQAMDQASYQSVNIDKLMKKVSDRLAKLLQCEAAIVTSGCAGALAHATARLRRRSRSGEAPSTAKNGWLEGGSDHAQAVAKYVRFRDK